MSAVLTDLRILSARDLDQAEAVVTGDPGGAEKVFMCRQHGRLLYAWWCSKRRLVVFRCRDCPPGEQDRVGMRIA